MKKATALIVVFSFLLFTFGFDSLSYAQVEKIPAEEVAREIGTRAGGTYIEGAAPPTITGTEIALPVIDEETGNILGYIVAEKESLIKELKNSGLAEVAEALEDVAAGTIAGVGTAGEAAGETVEAGMIGGTTGAVLLGIAAAVGIALAVGSSGGSTSQHP
jgi:hypothetical protein